MAKKKVIRKIPFITKGLEQIYFKKQLHIDNQSLIN